MSNNIYIQLFLSFLKIGSFTIGGGYVMIPLIEKEVVDNKKWIDKEYFLDMLALAQSAPGVMAVNTAIFVGYKIKGIRGALLATLGTILPSFFVILSIAILFVEIKDNPVVNRVFMGIRPAVVALIAVAVYKMAKTAKINLKTIAIPIIAVILIWHFEVSPVYVIIGAIVLALIITPKSPKGDLQANKDKR
jgi:chromate transporter